MGYFMNCIPYLSPLDACVMKVQRKKLISGRCWKVHCCLASGIKQLYFNFTRSWVKINFLASIEVCIFEIKLETLLILLVFNLSHFSFEFENFKCQRDSNSASAIIKNSPTHHLRTQHHHNKPYFGVYTSLRNNQSH